MERSGCVFINKPKYLDPTQVKQIAEKPNHWDKITHPDALVIRFGYNAQEMSYGQGADTQNFYNNHPICDQRGISFRRPILSGSSLADITGVEETLHLGRDYSTIGCGLYNSMGEEREVSVNGVMNDVYKNYTLTVGGPDWYD